MHWNYQKTTVALNFVEQNSQNIIAYRAKDVNIADVLVHIRVNNHIDRDEFDF